MSMRPIIPVVVILVVALAPSCARHDYGGGGGLVSSIGATTQTTFAGAGVAQVSAAASEVMRARGYSVEHRSDSDSEATVIGVAAGPARKVRLVCTVAQARDGVTLRVSRVPSDDGAAARSLIDDVSGLIGGTN